MMFGIIWLNYGMFNPTYLKIQKDCLQCLISRRDDVVPLSVGETVVLGLGLYMPRNLRFEHCERCSHWPLYSARGVHQSNRHSSIPPSCMACPRNDHFPLHGGASASIHLGHSMVYLPRDLVNEHGERCDMSPQGPSLREHRSNFSSFTSCPYFALHVLSCMGRCTHAVLTCERILRSRPGSFDPWSIGMMDICKGLNYCSLTFRSIKI